MINSLGKPKGMDRREFIKGVGIVSGGLIFSVMFGGCEWLTELIENRPVRRRLRIGSAAVDNAIAIYKEAVNQMKALPSSDPRSWAAQAAIHGTPSGFNLCEHGTNHFFPWHRAYLLYFEQICQELTGEPDFGLPYWNWNQNPDMHPEFTNPGSPLYHDRVNTSVAGNPAFSDGELCQIFADNNFFTFSSQLEGSPHGIAHVVVGGDMGGFTSAQDPIFWAHHCMVDYCWAKWNIELGNSNPNNSTWVNESWNYFVDGNGNPVNVSAGITPLFPLLSYRYESSAVGDCVAPERVAAQNMEEIRKRLEEGADIDVEYLKRIPIVRGVELPIAKPYSMKTGALTQDFSRLIESEEHDDRIFVKINYAKLPPVNDFLVRVFVNLPDANARTSTEDIHYAGSFAFFGTHTGDHGDHHPKTDFMVNVTDTLKDLKRRGKLRLGEAPLTLQLVAVPVTGQFARPDAVLTLEEVELNVSRVTIRTKQDNQVPNPE